MRPAPRRAGGISFLRGSGGDCGYLQERRRLFRLRKGSPTRAISSNRALHHERITRFEHACAYMYTYIYIYVYTYTRVYVRAGHNSCDINGISIAIWLRAAYTCAQPSLDRVRGLKTRAMTHPTCAQLARVAFVSSPNPDHIGVRSANRSRNMAAPLYTGTREPSHA